MATREGFVYRGRSEEDIDAQANQTSSAYDKIIIDRFPTLKVEKGDHSFRVLPPTFNKTKEDKKKYGNHWGLKIFVHRNVGPKDQMYLCLDAMKGEQCPICEFAKELEADGESEDAYQLRQQFVYLAWAVDREDEGAGPQVWMVPWTLDRDIGVLCKDKKTKEILLIDHPDDGYDVDFRREGKGLGTKYVGVRIARDPSPISDNSKRQARWLAFVDDNPLTSVLNFFEPDYLEEQVKASGESSKKKKKKQADEDEEDEPKKKGGGLKRRRVDEEDEDEEDKPKKKKPSRDEDEDEDEDEKPKKKKPAADEDEEDEPAPKKKKPSRDEDEEDEDEKPKPKKKPAKDEDEDDTDNDADEDEKPKKKKPSRDEEDEEDEKPKKKKPSRDEDEEDEDASSSAKRALKRNKRDEDEDEDEKPKKKKPSRDEDDD